VLREPSSGCPRQGGHRESRLGLRSPNAATGPEEPRWPKASTALAEVVEKGADTDVLRQMIQFIAQRLMDLDVECLCGAAYGERSPERVKSRHGYRERARGMRAGTVELKIPKIRAGSYLRGFWSPGARPRRRRRH